MALDGARLALAWSEDAPVQPAHAGHGAAMKDPGARMPLPTVGPRSVVVRDGILE